MAGNTIQDKIKAGATIIDVRTKDEYDDEFYPGAINIPVNKLESRLADIGPKEKPVIVYCATGSRSAMAQMILKSRGFTDVINAGGLEDMPT